MPRKKRSSRRKVTRNIGFGCLELTKFVNLVMISGKKAKAESIVNSALKAISSSSEKAIEVFLQAVENVKPSVEVRPKRIGGANYRVPVEMKPMRRTMLALRWLKLASRQRKERSAAIGIYKEILDASNKKGIAIKRRDEMHRLAETNRAFMHFRSRV